jgi:hypothetical protein
LTGAIINPQQLPGVYGKGDSIEGLRKKFHPFNF